MRQDDALRRACGLALVVLRRRHGLSQEKLALEAEISRVHLSDLERGLRMPKLDMLVRIAEGLGIPLPVLAREIEHNYKALLAKD